MSRITLYGWYQYDPTLFDDISIPTECDKDLLIQCIMEQSGDLWTYYQQPVRLKQNITNWFKRMQPNFSKLFDAILAEYDPIENYNRYFTETKSRTDTGSGKTEASSSGSTNANATGTRTDKVASFDDDDFQNANYTSSTNDSSNTSSDKSSSESSNTNSASESNTAHLHGNIGITTSQAMVNAELELRFYDVYYEIARHFEKQFLIQVY